MWLVFCGCVGVSVFFFHVENGVRAVAGFQECTLVLLSRVPIYYWRAAEYGMRDNPVAAKWQ